MSVKPVPPPSSRLLFLPAHDTEYVHFAGAKVRPFEPESAGFSATNAWWLADAALLAYWPPEQAPATFARAGLVHTQFFTHGSTQCYVASNEQFAITSFRGTEINHLEDQLADADIKLTQWDAEGRVHHGFLGALDLVWPAVEAHLATLQRRTLWFTGHSLGAALATLAARRYTRPGRAVAGLYTIGSPRVGDREFVAGFQVALLGRSFRYVNGKDGVTDVPPPALGYEHVAEERHLDSESLPHPLLAGLGAPLIDHTPRRYATLIWNEIP